MEGTSGESSTMSPLGAGSTAHPSYVAHPGDRDASSFASPLVADERRDTLVTLDSAQSLCSIPFSGKMPAASNNLSLASNVVTNKEDSTTGSWAGARCDGSGTLSQAEGTTPARRPVFAAWNAMRAADRGSSAPERSTAVRVVALAEEQLATAQRDRYNSISAAAAFYGGDARRGSAGLDDSARRWQPQGLLCGQRELFEVRAANGDTGSMFAVLLNGEVPDDLPPLPPRTEEPRSRPSTPRVDAIHLRGDYGSVTPFMSISSPFSASMRSMSRLRTSMPQNTGSSLHGLGSSSSLTVANEMPLPVEPAASEALPYGASPLHPMSVLSRRGSEPTKLREVTFVPAQLREAERSVTMVTANPSTFSPGNSTANKHHSSPMSANAPTVPCTPVAQRLGPGSPAALSGWRCAAEEQQERRAIARDQVSSFEKLLEREVSAYLTLSRQQRAAARKRNELPGASMQQQLVDAETLQFHDSMRARMRAAELAHQDSLRSFQLHDSLPSTSTAGDRAPRTTSLPTYQLQIEGEDATRTYTRGVPRLHGVDRSVDATGASTPPPRPLSLETHGTAAAADGRKGAGDPLVSTEIQRQLRLGRLSVSKADAWTADCVAMKLH